MKKASVKIKRNIPVSAKEKPRRVWPFRDMKLGDVVDVKDRNEWREYVTNAHAFAGKQDPKWTFHTQWMETFGRIRRLS